MTLINTLLAAAPKAGSQGFVNNIETEFDFAKYATLGDFINVLTPLAFSIAAMLVVFYFLIGAFELITSQGDKAHIVSARAKIYHSIIGFILLIVLFLVMQYIVPALLGDPNTSFKIF